MFDKSIKLDLRQIARKMQKSCTCCYDEESSVTVWFNNKNRLLKPDKCCINAGKRNKHF